MLCQSSTPPTWILEAPEFRSWRFDQNKMLWLSAPSGYGESCLASFIIEELLEGQDYWTAFFCKESESLYKTHILRAIACQYSTFSDVFRDEIKFQWKTVRGVYNLTAPIDDLFESLLRKPLAKALHTSRFHAFLILDGLNECPRDSLPNLHLFLRLLQNIERMKVLLSSQLVRELHESMQGVETLELNANRNWPIIESYVRGRLITMIISLLDLKMSTRTP